MVLEEPQSASGLRQESEVGQWVPGSQAGVTGVCHRQAVQHLCPTAERGATACHLPGMKGQSPSPSCHSSATLASCRPSWPSTPKADSPKPMMGISPQMDFQDSIQALVERPGGVVPCPVVVLTVRVGEEIPTQHWKPWGLGSICSPLALDARITRYTPSYHMLLNTRLSITQCLVLTA